MARKKQKLNILNSLEASLPKTKFNLNSKQVEKLNNIAEVILSITATLGVAALAIIAPNALQLINKAKWVKKTYKNLTSKREDQKQKIARAFYYLRQQKYVEIIPQKDKFLVKITQKGEQKISEISFRSLALTHNQKWDGNWWLAIADIPVEYRSQILLFRKKIKALGLYTLQRSVWIYPHDFRREIAFLAKYYSLAQYITFIEAKTLETEDEIKLKKHFRGLGVI